MAVPIVAEPAEHLVDFLVYVLLGVLRIGLNFARFFLASHWPRLEGIAPDPQSIWAKINRPSDDYAVVYVDDGSIYFGWIEDYTFDPDAKDNDFLLADAKRVD